MITRIIVSTVASLFVASIAVSQMKYSRANSQKPTPTPTPIPKTAAVQTQSPAPQPRTTSVLRTTPAPVQQKASPTPAPPQRTTPMQMQQSSTMPRKTAAAPNQPRPTATPAPIQVKPTPTPVPPPDVKAYLDRQVANSKDKKFHFTANGKDLALTPFHVWVQKSTGPNSTSTCIDMRSDDGRIYDIDFVTTGAQVTGIRIHKINGEALR
jgi:hypothetical protein